MNPLPPLLLCVLMAALLCQCSGTEEKSKNVKEMTLAQRAMQKPDEKVRSQFEKYIGGKGMKGSTGSWYQRQMHHSKGFSGGNAYAGQKGFKAGQSWFGKSKAQGMDMTYSMGGKQASMAGNSFKSGQSRFTNQAANEAGSAFGAGGDVFSTRSALPRSQSGSKIPHIIENIEATSTKKSAYTEEDVKSLLGR